MDVPMENFHESDMSRAMDELYELQARLTAKEECITQLGAEVDAIQQHADKQHERIVQLEAEHEKLTGELKQFNAFMGKLEQERKGKVLVGVGTLQVVVQVLNQVTQTEDVQLVCRALEIALKDQTEGE